MSGFCGPMESCIPDAADSTAKVTSHTHCRCTMGFVREGGIFPSTSYVLYLGSVNETTARLIGEKAYKVYFMFLILCV